MQAAENVSKRSDAAPKQPQDVSQIVVQVRDCIRWLTNENIQSDPEGAMKKAGSLREHSRIRAMYSPADQPRIIQAYIDGSIDVFIRIWKLKNNVSIVEDKQPLVQIYRSVVASVWNLTDISPEACQLAIQNNILDCILTDLRKPEFLDIRHTKSDSTVVFYLTSGYLGILNNLLNLCPQSSNVIKQNDGVETIKLYIDTTWHKPKTKALFLLSNLLADDKKDQLSAILKKSNVAYLLKILDDALSQPNHFSKVYGYTVTELLTSLNNVANYSEFFVSILIELGFVDTLDELLVAANAPDAQYSGDKKFSFSTLEEKSAACGNLWSFAFYPKSAEVLRSKARLVETLEKLSESAASNEQSYQLKRNAGGALWELRRSMPDRGGSASTLRRKKMTPTKVDKKAAAEDIVAAGPFGPPVPPSPKQTRQDGHVMVSYCWSSQSTVKKLVKCLNDRGVKTWFDVENMRGNIVEAMADAVENASAVLICFSQEYFQSANCRAEAQYAFQLNKRIVPVRLQDYKASGWLAMIIAMRLWYDLSDAKNFDTSLSKLCDDLRSGGNSSRVAPLPPPPSSHHHVAAEAVPKLNLDTDNDPGPGFMSAPHFMPPNAGPGPGNPYNILKSWSPADVQKWLVDSGLEKHKSKFGQVDGIMLHEMVLMDMRTPAFLYEQLKSDLKLDFLSLLMFVHALHRLVENVSY